MCHTVRLATGAQPPTQRSLPIRTGRSRLRSFIATGLDRARGWVYCSACHGSPHAEYSTLQANANLYRQQLQGHAGTIADCAVRHTNVPTTANGGPHNMHNIGWLWVNGHGDRVEQVGMDASTYCNGSTFRG